nr:PIN domain-containing protein [uncultured Carboxylicivirga sp.]
MSNTGNSYIKKLLTQIEKIELLVDEMLDNSSIYYHDYNQGSSVILIGASPYHWGDKDEKTQLVIKEIYLKFIDNFELLLENANPKTKNEIERSKNNILNLIEQRRAPSSIENGKEQCRSYFKVFKDYLHLYKEDIVKTVIVPDTNSLIQYPEPISYKSISPTSKFDFVILPTVLSELDKHKMVHRNEDFRKKVTSVIKRLKGYRNQGDVLSGVRVNKTITLKMVATEPDFEKTLNWLDFKNNDDRIIANVLELQISNPNDNIVFITSDINLQNKAQLANLNSFDTDELE